MLNLDEISFLNEKGEAWKLNNQANFHYSEQIQSPIKLIFSSRKTLSMFRFPISTCKYPSLNFPRIIERSTNRVEISATGTEKSFPTEEPQNPHTIIQ